MLTLSDMPANNPLTTRVRNQSITISQEQCQKMMGLSKNKQTSTKEGEREVLKVQKMFPPILCVKKHFGEEFLQQSQQCQQLYELCSELIYTVTKSAAISWISVVSLSGNCPPKQSEMQLYREGEQIFATQIYLKKTKNLGVSSSKWCCI